MEEKKSARYSIRSQITFTVLLIFIACIWALSFYASRMLHEDMKRLLGDQQFSTVSLVAAEIDNELKERMKVLELVARAVTPIMLDNPIVLQKFLDQRYFLRAHFNAGFLALSHKGLVIANVSDGKDRVGENYADYDAVRAALTDGKSSVGQPLAIPKPHTAVFAIVTPIRNAQNKVVGAFAGVIDLSKPSFMRHIQAISYGKNGYYLVGAPQRNMWIAATDNSRIMAPMPAPGNSLLVDRARQGFEGYGIARNSRGVESLTSTKRIPAAGWLLFASLPTDEAFAPIHNMQRRIVIAALLLTLLAAVLAWWALRHQFSPLLTAVDKLAAMSDAVKPLLPMPVVRQDEIGELISGFNRLLVTLAQREEALKESEFRWKFAIEGSGDGLWDWNLVDGTVFFTRRWKEMLGFAEDEVGNSLDEWEKRIHPDDKTETFAKMRAYFDGKSPNYVSEHRVRCKDGGYKWILDRGMVVSRGEDGRPLRMIGTHTDITLHKLAETEREEALDRLQKIAARVPGVVFQFRLRADGSSCVPYASEAIRDIYRLSPNDVRDDAAPVFAAVHPNDFPDHFASIQLSAQNLTPWHNEYRLKFVGEPDVWLLGNALPQRETDGSVLWHGFISDVTERKRADLALAESESRFREIFNAVSDAIFIHDAETGRIIDVNQRMCEMYGFTHEEAINCGPDDLSADTPPYTCVEAFEKIRKVHAEGPQTFDWMARKRDGHLFWVEVSLKSALIDSQPRILAVVRDITERKHLEESLRQMNETLEKRVREETVKNMEQERLMIQQSRLAAMGEMIGNIAHQWRQPINALTLILGNLKDAYEYNELTKEYLDDEVKIGQALIQRMSGTIDDFRNFFKPSKEKQHFIVRDGIMEAINLVSKSFQNNGIEITLKKSAVACSAFGYPNEFAQVVLNALTNAKEAITARHIVGEIHIKEECKDSYTTVTLHDNGGGIPEAILGKVFDPYFTTKEKGTGIGLYMSKMIMVNMGGDIIIRNVEGGAEVLITLPLASNPSVS